MCDLAAVDPCCCWQICTVWRPWILFAAGSLRAPWRRNRSNASRRLLPRVPYRDYRSASGSPGAHTHARARTRTHAHAHDTHAHAHAHAHARTHTHTRARTRTRHTRTRTRTGRATKPSAAGGAAVDRNSSASVDPRTSHRRRGTTAVCSPAQHPYVLAQCACARDRRLKTEHGRLVSSVVGHNADAPTPTEDCLPGIFNLRSSVQNLLLVQGAHVSALKTRPLR